LIAAFSQAYDFTAIIPVSAKTGDGMDVLVGEIKKHLQPGPRYFPEDSLTDQTERMIAAELIREQILKKTPRGNSPRHCSVDRIVQGNIQTMR